MYILRQSKTLVLSTDQPAATIGSVSLLGAPGPTDIRSQIAAEWSQIAQRSQWRAYWKPPSLFLTVPSLTPYDLPFPQMGVPYAPNIREWPYLCNG